MQLGDLLFTGKGLKMLLGKIAGFFLWLVVGEQYASLGQAERRTCWTLNLPRPYARHHSLSVLALTLCTASFRPPLLLCGLRDDGNCFLGVVVDRGGVVERVPHRHWELLPCCCSHWAKLAEVQPGQAGGIH